MDITTLFKACVKAIRTTNKSIHSINSNPESPIASPRTVHKDPHLSTAKQVVKQITHLQSFLLDNKAAYLNVVNYLSTNKSMNEVDREKIDSTAEEIVQTCRKLIEEFRRGALKGGDQSQVREHYANVGDLLSNYLKQVSAIYTESKAIRVKRVLEAHKVSKLETTSVGSGGSALPPATPVVSSEIENQLSAEEIQMFETENDLLFNELNATSEEVRQMEGKVVHIAELQELFTEKVLQQEQDIERISTNVVGATSNLQDANEQIRQAIQRNAGLRVWVLFFLLVMSFSLLFLDWYND